MLCPKCGKQVDESDAFCRSCGFAVSGDKPASGEPLAHAPAPGPWRDAEQPTRRSGEATASLILGLFSFIPVVGLLAVIFGHLARASIRRSGAVAWGWDGGLGLTLGYLSLGGWTTYGLWFLIKLSLPSTRRAEDRAFDERSAIMLLRTINAAATTYASTYNQGYRPNLAAMGPPTPGMKESAQAAASSPRGRHRGHISATGSRTWQERGSMAAWKLTPSMLTPK